MKSLLLNKKICNLILAYCFICIPLLAQDQGLRYYNIYIQLPQDKYMSGICIIRQEEGIEVMSIINEFGIKAFDAIYQNQKNKIKLQNVIAPLNKWYKRKVIAKDMRLLFNPEKNQSRHRSIEYKEDGSILLKNNRFNIIYTLQPIKENVTK